MNRSDETLFDTRIAAWLEDDPHSAPDQALDVVLAAVPSISQRRARRVPWRVSDMSSPSRFVLVAAIAVAVGGFVVIGLSDQGSGVGPGASAHSLAPSTPGSPIPTSPPATELAGTLAFRSIVNGAVDVAIMRPDGSGFRRLTNDPRNDSGPILSTDGQRVIFERTDPLTGAADIWIVNADGSGERPVTQTTEFEDWPSWSPDGRRAAFTRGLTVGGETVAMAIVIREVGPEAHLVPPETDTVVIRRDVPLDGFLDFKPMWSPDGGLIAFASNMDGAYALYTIRPDGSDLRKVSTVRAEGRPSWSPDASTLAFQDIHDGGCVWAVDAAGGEPRLVSKTQCTDGPVAWSPDGSLIAWAGGRSGASISVANADGTNQRQLAADLTYGDLSWGVTKP